MLVHFNQQDGGHGSLTSAKECVTTHLPNGLAPKWMALKRVTDTQSLLLHDAAMSRRAGEVALKLLA